MLEKIVIIFAVIYFHKYFPLRFLQGLEPPREFKKEANLKLVPAIFYSFSKWYHFKNHEKYFLFHLKSSFCFQDIQIFVSPLLVFLLATA